MARSHAMEADDCDDPVVAWAKFDMLASAALVNLGNKTTQLRKAHDDLRGC